jgi:hypothetical protein
MHIKQKPASTDNVPNQLRILNGGKCTRRFDPDSVRPRNLRDLITLDFELFRRKHDRRRDGASSAPGGRCSRASHGAVGTELLEVRRSIYTLLLEEAWCTAMRSRHYLTTQCLDTPNDSAWMVLYHHSSDLNFLNATSLTR